MRRGGLEGNSAEYPPYVDYFMFNSDPFLFSLSLSVDWLLQLLVVYLLMSRHSKSLLISNFQLILSPSNLSIIVGTIPRSPSHTPIQERADSKSRYSLGTNLK